MAKQKQWKSRIIGQGEEVPDQMLANPKNWRIHPKAQQDALEGVLNEVGWVQQVIVNKTTGFVLDGHARVALAISRGEKSVPVVYVELTEAEEDIILASLDPIAAMAGTDSEKIEELLSEISVGDEALRNFLTAGDAKLGEEFGEGIAHDVEVCICECGHEHAKKTIPVAAATG